MFLAAFYLGTSEAVHCERDVWMLPVAVAAAGLRCRQVQRIASSWPARRRVFGMALAEGLLWGAAVWIKPHVFLPAVACWLAGVLVSGGYLRRQAGSTLVDAAGLLTGGLLAGAAGIGWLIASGAWPHFMDTALHWSAEYARRSQWPLAIRLGGLVELGLFRLHPWFLLTLPALAAAVWILWRTIRQPGTAPAHDAGRAIFAALYLGWFVQAVAVQIPHEYVLASAVPLAMALLAAWLPLWANRRRATLLLAVFAALAAWGHPLLDGRRLACWPQTWRGSSAVLRDRLSLVPDKAIGRPQWQELQRVADFLRRQQVRDGELLCFNDSTHPLYLLLDIDEAARYFHFNQVMLFFPEKRPAILAELQARQPRFVVSDVRGTWDWLYLSSGGDLSVSRPMDSRNLPAWTRRLFPFYEPVVLHAGIYSVHRVTRPVQRFWPVAEDFSPATNR